MSTLTSSRAPGRALAWTRRRLLTLCTAMLASMALPALADEPAGVAFSVIKTAKLAVREGMTYSGGSFSKWGQSNFSAFLVQHPRGSFLFDTGLGSHIAEQYAQDMRWWQRPFFKYEDPVEPARAQLDRAGLPPVQRIILSHGHWDHASALGDFPQAEVWAPAPEMDFMHSGHSGVGRAWPSQVALKGIRWHTFAFKPIPFEGFDSSLDLFEDGRVVLVPMYGHTAGSIGLFLKVDSGRRYLFCGDVVWNAQALDAGSPKFWPAKMLVDHDPDETLRTIDLIRAAMKRDPGLVVVPAHDSTVQNALGYFPQWVR